MSIKLHFATSVLPLAIVATTLLGGWLLFFAPSRNDNVGSFYYTLTHEQVPSYFQESFILTGYRRPGLTVFDCLKSMFCPHNETVNIWTHLLAALWFWKKALNYYYQNRKATPQDASHKQALSQYCASQAAVFTASFIAHTFSPAATNEEDYQRLWRLDWSMIAVAMLGVSLLLAHLAFHGNQRHYFWKRAFVFSTGTMFVMVNAPFFTKMPPHWKALGALLPIPTLLWFAYETHQLSRRRALPPTFLTDNILKPLLLAATGLAIYAAQVPERFYPGTFDLSGRSHTVHHLWTTTFSLWMLQNGQHYFQNSPGQRKDEHNSDKFLLPV